MSEGVVWRQRLVPPWAWWLVWALLVAVAVVPHFVVESTYSLLVEVPVYAFTWGIPLWIAVLTMWSVNRYGAITLTHDVLRVGRDRVPVDSITRASVEHQATLVPTLAERLGRSVDSVQLPGRQHSVGSNVKLLGGSFGTPAGADRVVLTLTDAKQVAVPTRDREGLLGALLTVTA